MKKETPIPKAVKAKLIQTIKNQIWTRAKTYEKDAPHEYFVVFGNWDIFKFFKEIIDKYGVNELFQSPRTKEPYKCKYLYIGKYRYWAMYPALNRTETKYIRYKNGVSYQVIK